jgi:hypothetical protein
MNIRKVPGVATIGAIALVLGAAPGALADGPGTRESPAVVEAIQQQDWPEYQRDDEAEDIRAAQHLLRGYVLEPESSRRYDIPAHGVLDAATAEALWSFQGWRDVEATGELDAPTWDEFSADLEDRPIDGDHDHGVEHVRAVQVLLNKHGAGVEEDGIFGPITRAAVRTFQRDHELTPDGDVGPLTFAALVVFQDS